MFRISGGINCLDSVENSDTGGPIQLPLGWNPYVLFNTDIVNFAWKTDDAESIVLLVFVIWRCLNLRWMRGGGVRL